MPRKITHRELDQTATQLLDAAQSIRSAGGDVKQAEHLELLAAASTRAARVNEAQEESELRYIAEHGTTLGSGATSGPEIDDFRHYIETSEKRAALVASTGANGGFIVPEPIHAPLIEKVRKVNPIVDLAHQFNLDQGNTAMKLPFKATHGTTANATETGARAESTEPTFTSATLTAYDYYSDQRASQVEVDSVPGFSDLMLSWLYADIYEQLGVDVAVGDGNTKASGLFAATGTYANVLSGSAGAIANTMFPNMLTSLHPKYRSSAVWLMNSATLGVCLSLSMPNLNNTPLVQWVNGKPTILGIEVRECQSAPSIGAANFPIALGDISQAYAIATHRQPSVLVDPYTVPPYVRYYGLARIGGMPWDSQACVLGKSNNS
jgi:HK97 family phage major capsid protein